MMPMHNQHLVAIPRTAPKALAVLFALVCLVLATALPAQRAYADQGSFTITAVDASGGNLIAPVAVPYEDGQTVREALEATSYGFEFGGDGFLSSVAGYNPIEAASSFTYTFTNMDAASSQMLGNIAAADIQALYISAYRNTWPLGDGHVAMLEQIGVYQGRTDGVRNYAPATVAYNQAMAGSPTATDAAALTLANRLESAIAAYDEIMNGPKRTVTFAVTKGGNAVANPSITMTDQYGNTTVGQGGVVQVVEGTYSYEVFDEDGTNGVRCSSFVVADPKQETEGGEQGQSNEGGEQGQGDEGGNQGEAGEGSSEGQTVAVELPAENWFRDANLYLKSVDKDWRVPVSKTGSAQSRTMVFHIPDTALETTDLRASVTASRALTKIENYTALYTPYMRYVNTRGVQANTRVGFSNTSYAPNYLVKPGTEGNTFDFEIRTFLDEARTTTQVEILHASADRTPTLSALSVQEAGTEILGGFGPHTKSYEVATAANSLMVYPRAFGSAEQGYAVTVNGSPVVEGQGKEVDLSGVATGSSTTVQVVVSLPNGQSSTYTIVVNKRAATNITLTHDTDVSVSVANAREAPSRPYRRVRVLRCLACSMARPTPTLLPRMSITTPRRSLLLWRVRRCRRLLPRQMTMWLPTA